jgi:hypothetical protein
MTSEKKTAANRLNAKRSTGPRTSRGKSRASGNAWRYGWAAAKSVPSTVHADVEQMAQAICGDHASPALYEQAVIIAECEIALLKLRADRIAIIERYRVVGLKPERANQRLDVSLNEELALERGPQRRGDVHALERALAELVSLERYEQRAFSRRKRAIRMLEAISIVAPFLGRDGGGMVTTEEQARVPQPRSSHVRGDGFS